MIYALDTNVILDILFRDEKFHESSKRFLEEISQKGVFVICPEVYSELAAAFGYEFDEPEAELEIFLDNKQIRLQEHTRESLSAAGKAWRNNETGGVQCSSCGVSNDPSCRDCGSDLSWRNHVITDLMVGGHAESVADALITRDSGYFDEHFDVEILDPSAG